MTSTAAASRIFPHHEDEIAQAEAATGKPFVRYWLHNNMVTVNGQKMGKSLGNFIPLKDAFAGNPPLDKPVRPMVIRYFVLTSHYRSPLDFSVEALDAAKKGLERIENTVGRVPAGAGPGGWTGRPQASSLRSSRRRARSSPLRWTTTSTPPAPSAALSSFTREVNRLLDAGGRQRVGALRDVAGVYEKLGGDVLGIVTAQTG